MIRVHELKIRLLEDSSEKHYEKIAKMLHIKKEDILKLEIKKKSIDARNKQDIWYVYDFLVKVKHEKEVLMHCKHDNIFQEVETKTNNLPLGTIPLNNRIIVVGSGPAGLFASYFLALYGYQPLIIERGKKLEERIEDVKTFWNENILNTESNVQFGEGGAGTFSDGKLNTLVKDKENLIP